jgi:hypothetical protein
MLNLMNFPEWRDRILQARKRAAVGSPWSLVECAFENGFHAELLAAWRNCVAGVAESALHSPLRMADLGLVLLAAISEIARENGREGALWPAVRCGIGLRRETEAVLFAPNGHPRHALKDAIEAACLRFGLRHVIGIEGVQEWFGSVFLQTGFTRKGAMSRLPEWLAGYVRPIAVSRLLEAGPLHSASFAKLWNTLAEFRRGNIGHQSAASLLRCSCWTKPEWSEELLTAALRRRHLGVAAAGAAAGEEGAPTFLDGPWLVWDGATEPQWELQIAGLDLLGLAENFYRVVAGDTKAILQRQADGLFAYQPSNTLRLPMAATPDGRVDAVILDARGAVVAHQEVRFFDPDADIVAFKVQNGRGESNDRFLDGHAGAGHDYWLLVADDLTVLPPPGLSQNLQALRRQLCRVEAACMPALRVCFDDGEVLWQPNLAAAQPLPGTNSVSVKIEDFGARGGVEESSFQLQIGHGAGVEILRVRWRGKSWPVVNGFAGPIPSVEVLEAGILNVQIRGRADGHPFLCRRELHYSKQGVLECSETGRRWGPHLTRRSVRQIARNRYRVMPPMEHGTPLSEWTLLAGEQQITRLREGRTLQLREVPGYGEALRLKKGPFNAPESLDIINEVVDTGLFSYREVTPPPGALWNLKLWEPLELDGSFAVVHGTIGYAPVVTPAMETVIVTDADAHLKFPEGPCDYLFLAYRGGRIGGWWRVGDA